jgi:hypothetical protein
MRAFKFPGGTGMAFSGNNIEDLMKVLDGDMFAATILNKASNPNPETEPEVKFVNIVDDLIAFVKSGTDFTLTIKTINLMLSNESYDWRSFRALWVTRRLIETYKDMTTEERPKITGAIHEMLRTSFEIFPNAPTSEQILVLGDIITLGTRAGLEGIWEAGTEFVGSKAPTWTIRNVYGFAINIFCRDVACEEHGFPDTIRRQSTDFILSLFSIVTDKINFHGEPWMGDVKQYFIPLALALCNRTEPERITVVARVRTIINNNPTESWTLILLNTLITQSQKVKDTPTPGFNDAIIQFRKFRTEITGIQEDSDSKLELSDK